MASINIVDAKALFSKSLLALYKEQTHPTAFLRSLFPSKESMSKNISWQVQRGTEKIAPDVLRGTDGNFNRSGSATEKIVESPYFHEYFNLTDLDLYDSLYISDSVDTVFFAEFMESVAAETKLYQEKIERSYELQCSQVLHTGVVTMNANTNIDFRRKAGSMVVTAPWTTGTNDPFAQVATGCKWIRQNGKSQGATFNLIVGETALPAFFNNTIVQAAGNLRRIDHMSIREPQRNSLGYTTHGEFSAGDYTIRLYSYPEFYDNASNVSTPYIDPKTAILLPEKTNFKLGFGAVPQLLSTGARPKKGAFVISDYIDQKKKTHEVHIESAGLAVPVAVDQIYTMQVTT